MKSPPSRNEPRQPLRRVVQPRKDALKVEAPPPPAFADSIGGFSVDPTSSGYVPISTLR